MKVLEKLRVTELARVWVIHGGGTEVLVATVARHLGFARDWTVGRLAISTLPYNSVHALTSVATQIAPKVLVLRYTLIQIQQQVGQHGVRGEFADLDAFVRFALSVGDQPLGSLKIGVVPRPVRR